MSDDNPTVVEVEFRRDEAKAALESLKREVPDMIKTQRELAKLIRAKYLALIETGFSHKDALKLCKKLEW